MGGHPGRPVFGTPSPAAVVRAGAYGVAVRDGCLLVAVTGTGALFLPGGGTAAGEQPAAALARELLEETGYEMTGSAPLCEADQFVVVRGTGEAFRKVCSFFVVTVGPAPVAGRPTEHVAAWVPVADAAARLHEEASRYAVGLVLR